MAEAIPVSFRVDVVFDSARVLSTAMRKPIRDQAHHPRDYSPQPARPAQAPRFLSARSSYPVFLSFQDTAKLQIGWAWRGFVDAFRWDVVIRLMTRNVCFHPCFISFLPHGNNLDGGVFFFVYPAMPRSARTRSSRSCSMAYRSSRSMSLTSSCTPCRGVGREGKKRDLRSREMGSIIELAGSIASCGCCLSLACRSISTCVPPQVQPLFLRAG
jgi:hypothetical protein